jgi:LemA protein
MKHSLPPPAVHARRGAVSRGCLIAAVVIILPVLLIGGCGVGQYNGLVAKRETVNSRWSTVESDYTRRAELIPSLVATVKGAANFEQETLEAVTQARNNATKVTIDAKDLDDPAKLQEYLGAQDQLGSALSRLLVSVEAYPELKATQGFRDLQVQLEGTENRINVSRQDYIRAVQDFNTSVKRFPANLLAGIFGFHELPQFKAEEKNLDVPVVDFSDKK